ncbi:MAG: GNAT family protein [Meiothermus sp.]|nr:GNAT family protein [Meiothermus sp.]
MLEVQLRPLTLSDISRVLRWSEDEEFCLANGWPLGLQRERLEDWFLRLINNPPADLIRLGIVVDGGLAGFVDLREVNPLEHRARLRIAIGDPGQRGQGVGYAAGLKMLEHAFGTLGLGRITAEVASSNLKMLGLLDKLGFTREGVLRSHETRNGVKEDLVLFGMLREEFSPRSVLPLLEAVSG